MGNKDVVLWDICYHPFMRSIRIKTFPDSKRELVEEVSPNVLRVFVRDSAQNNMANRAVIRVVGAFYGIPENKLRIIVGHRAHNKTLEVRE